MPTVAEIQAEIEELDELKDIPSVQAVALVHGEDVQGESAPATVRCTDDRLYIVKTNGDPGQRHLLASDLCFTRLARALRPDLAPEMSVVEFPAEFVNHHELPQMWMLGGEVPPGVGSLRIDNARDARLRSLYEQWDPSSLAWVIAFQTWCGGYDASAIVQDGTLQVWTIDHAHFACPETTEPESGNGKQAVFIPLGMDRGSALARAVPRIPDALESIEGLPGVEIVDAFAGVEPTWGLSAAARARVVDYLIRRRHRTREIIEPWLEYPTELSNTPPPDDM